ncbi:hypothetical protein [Desulfosarcina cetonica]|uniref:hypothetical protein n=1 Tax=Desulfosarcina cetonica TaxID=90730 RepID=UPI0006CF4B19|nr:hypothetical protein [Desulfosarcina cetonica]
MTRINAKDFIEELRFDIREKDIIKAKLVLSKIGAVDDNTRKMALFEISRADDPFAIPVIVNLIAEYRDLARAYRRCGKSFMPRPSITRKCCFPC